VSGVQAFDDDKPIPPASSVPPVRKEKKTGTMRRAKGIRGEREVKVAMEDAGLEVRGLEGRGDHLVFGHFLGPLHVESKFQENTRIFEWMEQAISEAPKGTTPIVVFRRSKGEWLVCIQLARFIK